MNKLDSIYKSFGVRPAGSKAWALTTVSAVVLTAALGAQSAYAQSAQTAQAGSAQTAQAPAIQEIVVTGSRVVTNGYEAPTPVTVMGPQQMQQANQPNIADAMAQLPAFGGDPEGSHSGGNSISTGRQGESQLNLRSLGVTRTLTLLDGHRFVSPDNDGSVDTNDFPAGLVSRVDVVQGGASAAYGSDALAGVVNFILDKNFTGIKGEVDGGVRTYGDDRTDNIELTAGTGFAGDRGHVLLDASYANDPGVFDWNTSPWHATPDHIVANPAYGTTAGLSTSVPQYLVLQNTSTILADPGGIIVSGPLKGITFSQTGQPFNYQYGPFVNSQYTQGGMYQYSDETQINQSLADHLFRDNVYSRVSYDISDNVNVFFQFIHAYSSEWARSKDDDTLGTMNILSGDPYIPGAIQAQMNTMGLTSFKMGSFNLDLPPLSSRFYRRTWSEAGGGSGKFDAFGTTWNWDVFAQGGFTKSSVYTNVYNTTLLPLALDAVTNPTTGAVVCRSTLTNPSNGCVPYNPFGWNVNSPAAVNYTNATAILYQDTSENDYAANVRGTPFSDWAGPVSLAFGIESRKESVSGIVDPGSQASDYTAGNYKVTAGSYTVTEGYAEVEVPLAKDQAWAKDLSFNGAIRGTGYSTSGYVTTWKAGVVYSPIDDVRFRVTKSRDIRAPNLSELFAGGQGGQSPGVINPFNGGSTFPTFLNNTLGNPNLQPEKADNLDLGVILQPTFLTGLTASINYYNIDIHGSITSVGAQDTINRCYAGESFYCTQIFTTTSGTVATPAQVAAGQVALVDATPFNLATETQQGIDFDITYDRPLSDFVSSWNGHINIHALVSHVMHQDVSDGENPVQNWAGDNATGGGLSGVLKTRYYITATYTNDPLTLGVTGRGFSSGNYGPLYTQCSSGCPVSTAVAQTISQDYLPGAFYMDVLFDYKFMHKDSSNIDMDAYLTIQNIMNKAPAPVANSSYWYMSTNPFVYDTMGRVFRAGIRFKM